MIQSAEHRAREKAAKLKAKEDGRREIQRRLKEIEEEKRKLYIDLTEQFDDRQAGIHTRVVEGTAKPFHYFKAQDPST